MNKKQKAMMEERLRLARQRVILAANGLEAEKIIKKALTGSIAVEFMSVQPNAGIAM